jgi:hypothetical protein
VEESVKERGTESAKEGKVEREINKKLLAV